MRLYTATRAPNPKRVDMFLAEKGVSDIQRVLVDLNASEHKKDGFLARNPLARVPVPEQPQFPDFGASEGQKMREIARWLDAHLASRPYVAGERFSIADITAFCAIEFARLIKFKPAGEGMIHLQAWRDRIAARPSAG